MHFVKTITLAAMLGAGLTASGAALAADMPEPYVEPAPPVIATGGWYLRGDIGYKWYNNPSTSFVTNTYVDNWNNSTLDNTGIIGLGAGYRFNDHFRVDATIDYEFQAGTYAEGYCGGCGGVGHTIETGNIDAWTFLANGYVDIGTWSGFTPYVGAGIGTSYLQTTDIGYLNPNGVSGTWDGAGNWNFAYALMAGVSYAFSPNVSVDLNYRYLNLGDAVSGYIPAGGGGTINYDNISANEVRLGLRYNFY
ncbi:porin family protein [Mesorhizobium sp. BR1-1-16]|uniref:outer membrane protein n=1 Tax=Mesorhizobium sp. BR1-1-16 TaxID=2876653 RepID=UPI001CC9ECC9|nr:outer membrane protein [Mesorhizobium sp. BR1-1-16]MBZ9936666.1 porin family protein [Mesorhizobium sp. BR1-1-16]